MIVCIRNQSWLKQSLWSDSARAWYLLLDGTVFIPYKTGLVCSLLAFICYYFDFMLQLRQSNLYFAYTNF
jgi:hypothetical protein